MQDNLLPAVNWLVHVLANNIGYVTWDGEERPDGGRMPVHHPILPGKCIILRDNRVYHIDCDSEETRELVIGMAKRYKELEDNNYRLSSEKRSDQWIPASQVPDGPLSACRRRRVLVTSPILQYVVADGVCEGYEDNGWHIQINGQSISHPVTHWRHLPPAPQAAPPYEEVKDQVKDLRTALGLIDKGQAL